jgi:hypothetical protein
VRLSEERELRDVTEHRFSTVPDEELVHAMAADVILALDTAKGVGEEIARFSAYPKIAQKLIVLSHERFRSAMSFAGEIRRPLAIAWYSDNDFDSCKLAKEICLKHVYAIALARFAAETQF